MIMIRTTEHKGGLNINFKLFFERNFGNKKGLQDCHISDKKMPKMPGKNDYIPCHGQLVNLASGEKKIVVKARKKKKKEFGCKVAS